MAKTVDDKVSYFQAITSDLDTDICTEILPPTTGTSSSLSPPSL
jgi:hypothetical protein